MKINDVKTKERKDRERDTSHKHGL